MEKEERHNLTIYHIHVALNPCLLYFVLRTPTTKEAWERLQNIFGEKKNDITESTMSHEVKLGIVAEDNPTVRESTVKMPQWMMKKSRKKNKTSMLILLKQRYKKWLKMVRKSLM